MARSRLDLRREHEAVEARKKAGGKAEDAAEKPKKARKAATKRPSRSKTKVAARKRLFWGVFSGSMKEEARFPYDQRAAAEERLEVLRSKSKKLYFIQPIKEVMGEGATPARPAVAAAPDIDEDFEDRAEAAEPDELDDIEPEEMELQDEEEEEEEEAEEE